MCKQQNAWNADKRQTYIVKSKGAGDKINKKRTQEGGKLKPFKVEFLILTFAKYSKLSNITYICI